MTGGLTRSSPKPCYHKNIPLQIVFIQNLPYLSLPVQTPSFPILCHRIADNHTSLHHSGKAKGLLTCRPVVWSKGKRCVKASTTAICGWCFYWIWVTDWKCRTVKRQAFLFIPLLILCVCVYACVCMHACVCVCVRACACFESGREVCRPLPADCVPPDNSGWGHSPGDALTRDAARQAQRSTLELRTRTHPRPAAAEASPGGSVTALHTDWQTYYHTDLSHDIKRAFHI